MGILAKKHPAEAALAAHRATLVTARDAAKTRFDAAATRVATLRTAAAKARDDADITGLTADADRLEADLADARAALSDARAALDAAERTIHDHDAGPAAKLQDALSAVATVERETARSLDLIRQIIESQRAATAGKMTLQAWRAIAPPGAQLVDPEVTTRGMPPREERILSTSYERRWAIVGGGLIAERHLSDIEQTRDGPRLGWNDAPVHQVVVRIDRVRPGDSGRSPDDMTRTLRLPGPSDSHYPVYDGSRVHDAQSALGALDEALASYDRQNKLAGRRDPNEPEPAVLERLTVVDAAEAAGKTVKPAPALPEPPEARARKPEPIRGPEINVEYRSIFSDGGGR